MFPLPSPLPIVHSKSNPERPNVHTASHSPGGSNVVPSGGDSRRHRSPREAAHFFPRPSFPNCEVGKAGGVTGARRAQADICHTISDGLSSEHGAAEGVSQAAQAQARSPERLSRGEHRSRSNWITRSAEPRATVALWRDPEGEAPERQLRLSRYCAANTPPQHVRVTGTIPGFPTEHSSPVRIQSGVLERERTRVSGQR
jgi:hypothetical protein